MDELLDILAAHSSFSDLSQPATPSMTATQIISRIYRDAGLSPLAMAVITQIILRDLRPLTNPLPRFSVQNPTAMLRLTTAHAPEQLVLLKALGIWDERAYELYKGGKGDVDWCCDMVDAMGDLEEVISAGSVLGVNVQVIHALLVEAFEGG